MGVCEHLFYTQCECLSVHLVCERACVHKVPPCKRLIVCVGNNSPIPQGMKPGTEKTRIYMDHKYMILKVHVATCIVYLG